MAYKIETNRIKDIISKMYFLNDGDYYESTYGDLLEDTFPNCETFWRHFVVPDTKRIQLEITDNKERIRPRDGVSEDIQDIASIHYSMFMNIIYSHNHLQNFGLSSFEDFYMHLGSTCDLVEEFLLKVYFLILECKAQKSEILEELNKNDFLKLAGEWYDNNYLKVYENYLKKGKSVRIDVPNRKNVLDEYFGKLNTWKHYKSYTQKIREYRNVIAHDVQIGKIITTSKDIALVPKKEKIQKYKRWPYVFAAGQDIRKLKNDFINMKEQMNSDVEDLEIILNELWEKPINDLKKLFLDDKNEKLLKKYNLYLI